METRLMVVMSRSYLDEGDDQDSDADPQDVLLQLLLDERAATLQQR